MRVRLKMLLAAALGFLVAHFFDPDRGRSRRARLTDQAKSKVRHGASNIRSQAEYRKGVAKGAVHTITDALRPDREYDNDTLLQKVRSEAIGQWKLNVSEPADVEVTIDDRSGAVRLTGRIPSEEGRAQLIDLVNGVDGVKALDDRTVVG